MTSNKKVFIQGAGIAGLTSAIVLATKGYDVEILEKRKSIGATFRGDFQGLENWTSSKDILTFLKEIKIPTDFQYEPFFECSYYDQYLNKYHLKSTRPGFYLIQRGSMKNSLDTFLFEYAKDLRVKVNLNHPGFFQNPNIIATGARYSILIVTGINFETNIEKIAIGLFDNSIAPSGYAYLVGLNGQATLAVVSTTKTKNLNGFLEKAVEKIGKILRFQINNPQRFGGQGTYYDKTLNGKPRIGEAGGFQDAMWGFGLRIAFQTGFLAAKAISEELDYWKLVQQEVIPFCKSSVVNRWLYDLYGSKNYRFILSKFQNAQDPLYFANKLYSPTKLKQIIFPMARYLINRKYFPVKRN